MIPASEALTRLRDGNRRFAADVGGADLGHDRRAELAGGQSPFAVILGCADSRVPAELVFDQGLGDLFVIRVAGNIVAPSQVGSVEFAVEKFDCRLVIVLGHTECGAIQATLDELERVSGRRSMNIASIVDRVRPSVEALLRTPLKGDRAALAKEAVRANIRASVNQLRHGSWLLEEAIASKGVQVVGAEYSLATGLVEFFDD